MNITSLNSDALRSLNFIYALYRNPVYKNCDYDEDGNVKKPENFGKTIKVAIVGFNEGGRQFLDTLLQVGQMPGRRLDVTVYSAEMDAEKQAYLDARPAFTEFFDVDDMSTKDSYGHISFKKSRWKEKANTTIAFFEELAVMDYVLFTEDEQESVEKEVGEILKENALKYRPVLLKAHYPEKSADITQKEDFAAFEGIAFNSHLVWRGTLETDLGDVENEFNDEYNYLSSLTYALSIKYKLHSAGVELTSGNAMQAAEKFIGIVNQYENNNADSKKAIAEMAAAEHRRWVAEKICTGWQRVGLDDITADDNHNKGKTDGEFKKHHYCIAKGGADNPLAGWSGEDWDSKPTDGLDELDNVSVITHRKFLEKAKQTATEVILELFSLENVSTEDNRNEYKDWRACVELILNSNAKKICRPYDSAYSRLLNVVESDDFRRRIESVNKRFRFVIKSREYDNQKQKDIDLVTRIPFILTFKKDMKLACEFTHGSNSMLFANVSVLKKFNPRSVTYFCECYAEIEKDIQHFLDCIRDYRWLRTGIAFIFASGSKNEYTKLKKLIDSQKLKADILPRDSYYEYISGAGKTCVADGADAVIYNNRILGFNLSRAGISCGYYHSDRGTFDKQSDIMLRAVNFDIAMTIQDILRINGAEGSKKPLPIGLDKAYEIYSKSYESKSEWKKLCRTLEELTENSDSNDSLEVRIDSVPDSEILRKLQEAGFITVDTDGGKRTLTFADRTVKNMLTKEGEILEIHIFNLCVASGLFDDVVTGYEITWESGNVSNEFDLLLVRGLKSAFGEIKTTTDNKYNDCGLQQKFYEKLEALDCKFGINSYEFMINDSIITKDGKPVREGNKIQISRGEQFGITTILPGQIKDTAQIIKNKMQ